MMETASLPFVVQTNAVFDYVLTTFLYCFLVNKDILEHLANIIYTVSSWFDMQIKS